jgi:hypothetical protein
VVSKAHRHADVLLRTGRPFDAAALERPAVAVRRVWSRLHEEPGLVWQIVPLMVDQTCEHGPRARHARVRRAVLKSDEHA